MADDEVVDLGARFGPAYVTLAVVRARFDETLDVLTRARETFGPVADRLQSYRRAVTVAATAGLDVPNPDLDLEREGAAAIETIERAFQQFRTARFGLVSKISSMVRAREFSIGDLVPTPYSKEPLTVASKNEPPADLPEPERELCEVTLTADGGLVEARHHNWRLDPDGKIIEDGTVPVRYERWGSTGLRVAGTVHPITRRVVATDMIELS